MGFRPPRGRLRSQGSTGDCYDNAAMETFWATLKRELSWIHGPLIYMNRARLRSALFDYIEIFYNRERAQTGLGHLSPLDMAATEKGSSITGSPLGLSGRDRRPDYLLPDCVAPQLVACWGVTVVPA